jgi:hypothetical protein
MKNRELSFLQRTSIFDILSASNDSNKTSRKRLHVIGLKAENS